MADECLSLDEFIRRKSMKDQFMLLNHRKRDRDIDKDELDFDLDEYVRESRVELMDEDDNMDGGTTCGKFNRPSMQDDDSSGDENDLGIRAVPLNASVIKEEEDEEEQDLSLGPHKPFTTVESREGIRVRSQHFRLLPENLVDRPAGVKRLLPLPLDESERYKKRRVLNGRVHKRNGSRVSSTTSFVSALTNVSSTGSYVEKGKFSYKVGEEGILGIDRVRRGPRTPPPSLAQTPAAGIGVTVNMNWDGFIEGLQKVTKPVPPPVVKQTDSDDLVRAASKLLQMLKGKNHFAKVEVDDEDF